MMLLNFPFKARTFLSFPRRSLQVHQKVIP
jgi:hypothetical protein